MINFFNYLTLLLNIPYIPSFCINHYECQNKSDRDCGHSSSKGKQNVKKL